MFSSTKADFHFLQVVRSAAKEETGQAVVEAAFLIPVVFMLILLLCQPLILLYNRMVMENAVAEGCRLLSTKTSMGYYSAEKYEGYVMRRLASIPPLEPFHVHDGLCSWEIELSGDEKARQVTVRITNKAKPLPLLGLGAGILGLCDDDGNFTQTAEATMPTQPSWVPDSDLGSPVD